MMGVSGGAAELGNEDDRYAFQGAMVFIDVSDGSILQKTWTIHPPVSEPGGSDDDFAGGTIWSTPAVVNVPDVGPRAFVGVGNPFKPWAEHEHTNAVLAYDIDPASDTWGEIVGSYKGSVDSYFPIPDDVPCYDIEGNPPPWYPQGAGSCFDIDLDFGASPERAHRPRDGTDADRRRPEVRHLPRVRRRHHGTGVDGAGGTGWTGGRRGGLHRLRRRAHLRAGDGARPRLGAGPRRPPEVGDPAGRRRALGQPGGRGQRRRLHHGLRGQPQRPRRGHRPPAAEAAPGPRLRHGRCCSAVVGRRVDRSEHRLRRGGDQRPARRLRGGPAARLHRRRPRGAVGAGAAGAARWPRRRRWPDRGRTRLPSPPPMPPR